MTEFLATLTIILGVLFASPQSPAPQSTPLRPELIGLLDFESDHSGGLPKGWNGGPPGTFGVDDQIVHGGRWALRIDRTAGGQEGFTAVSRMLPIDFAGTRLELSGFLRTEDVGGFAGLWMREDGDGGVVAFDNMQSRGLKGTTGWTEYTITLPLAPGAKRLVFGVLAAGGGRVWADDLRLLVDGKPVANAPRVEAERTALDLDKEFDAGSGIVLKDLTRTQIANLAMLGKVWGFLKYHHPAIAAGKRHWDYDLFRVLPRVLSAPDATAARSVVLGWVRGVGAVPACSPCASLVEGELHLKPPVTWLTDEGLGSALAGALRDIHQKRPAAERQFYVSLVPNIGNPEFVHEPAYELLKLPDAGYQLLGLYRFWNIIEYWFPYRDVIGESWDEVLTTFIPRIAQAADGDTYKREMMALIARVNDTHANLWSSLDVRPPVGACRIPVVARFIQDKPVVVEYAAGASGSATGLQIGDAIEAIDGVGVPALVERWSPYYAASNESTRLRDIAQSMTRGACGPATVRVTRPAGTVDVNTQRTATATTPGGGRRTNDRAGETFQKLSPEVAYLKLSSVQSAQAAKYIEAAAGTKGLIIDIRNYPSDFVVFALGAHLVDRATPFVRFTRGDPANPGAFHWTPPISLEPGLPRYSGKIVILVDEVSLSQSEYTAMAFRSAPNATVVGSTTAGADGNVSRIPLPGGLESRISGIGVFYPDKKPTQRVGILPDIVARPTIDGIRNGRDEVVEAALRHILGPGVPAGEIERMAKR
jgi:C-terminal processing protease CtpA/Prc